LLWFVGSHDYDDKHVYAERLTKEQVQDLPEFSEDLAINNDYEEQSEESIVR